MGSTSTIVLVTGANQGIGFEIAKKLASEEKGYHIIVSGRRKEAVEEAVESLQKQGLSVEPLVLDIASDESIEAAVKTVEAKHGHIDVLVNNAAISLGGAGVSDRAAWIRLFEINVFGTAMVTDAFLPLLEKSQTTKRIVFISSSLSSLNRRVDPKSPTHNTGQWRVYTTSKTPLNMIAVDYAIKYEKDPSWKINICCPGYCATNLNGFSGADTAASGAINACRLATLGPDGETGTFSSKDGPVPW